MTMTTDGDKEEKRVGPSGCAVRVCRILSIDILLHISLCPIVYTVNHTWKTTLEAPEANLTEQEGTDEVGGRAID